jgi:RNA polymerase-binding transcription factor DksA
MDADRRDLFETMLLNERERSLDALHRIEAEEAEPQASSAGDTVRGQKGMADAASDTLEQEIDFAVASRLSERLEDVDAALAVLREEPERFAHCSECGDCIEARRRELLPWTSTCAGCACRGESALVS